MPSCLETDLPIFDGEIKGRVPRERSDRLVIIGFKIDQGKKKVKCALLRICHLRDIRFSAYYTFLETPIQQINWSK